jgi:hypothetical protein
VSAVGIVQDLMATLHRGDTDADDAAVTLGLLIERERVHRPLGGNADEQLLGPELAARRLSHDETIEAVSLLTDYVLEAAEPRVSAIWALGKSADAAIVPALVVVFNQGVEDPQNEDLLQQVLQALYVNGIDSPYVSAAAEVFRRAAAEGRGEVQRLGTHYLQALGPEYRDV